jgi:hypothetical protein
VREPIDEKTRLGADVWYGFSIRVPVEFPKRQLRCVVAQIKMPFDDDGGGSPAFSLRIDDHRFIVTVEHLYEPEDKANNRFLSDPPNGACRLPSALALDHHDFDAIAPN